MQTGQDDARMNVERGRVLGIRIPGQANGQAGGEEAANNRREGEHLLGEPGLASLCSRQDCGRRVLDRPATRLQIVRRRRIVGRA